MSTDRDTILVSHVLDSDVLSSANPQTAKSVCDIYTPSPINSASQNYQHFQQLPPPIFHASAHSSAPRRRRNSLLPILLLVLFFLSVLALLPSLVAPIVYRVNFALEQAKADVARAMLQDFPESVKRASWVIKAVAPSVVGIETFQGNATTSEGSGVIIDSDGFLLTNYHVIAAAERIEVQLLDGRRVDDVTIIGYDAVMDLAVLKINSGELIPIDWGDSTQIEVGEQVLAIGNPFGFSHTATSGIVSAKERYSPSPSSRRLQEYLQIDAAINPGNSGGALVDMRGKLIGINTMIVGSGETFAGIGLAIPSNLAKHVYERIRADGRIVHGWMGVGVMPMTMVLAQKLGLEKPMGVVVTRIVFGSPAAQAGLRIGDILLDWDGQEIRDHLRFSHTVIITPPKTVVTLKVLRNGDELEITVTLGRRPVIESN